VARHFPATAKVVGTRQIKNLSCTLILVLLPFVVFSCKNESPKSTSEKAVQKNKTEIPLTQTYIPPTTGADESESFKRHFDEKKGWLY